MRKNVLFHVAFSVFAVIGIFLWLEFFFVPNIPYPKEQITNATTYKQIQMDTIYMQVASDIYKDSNIPNEYAYVEGKDDGNEIRVEVQYYIDKDGTIHNIDKTEFNLLSIGKLYPEYISDVPTTAIKANELDVHKGFEQTRNVGLEFKEKMSLNSEIPTVLYGVNPATTNVIPLTYMTLEGKLRCVALYANPTETRGNNPEYNIQNIIGRSN